MSTAYKCLNGRDYRERNSGILLMYVKLFPYFAYWWTFSGKVRILYQTSSNINAYTRILFIFWWDKSHIFVFLWMNITVNDRRPCNLCVLDNFSNTELHYKGSICNVAYSVPPIQKVPDFMFSFLSLSY